MSYEVRPLTLDIETSMIQNNDILACTIKIIGVRDYTGAYLYFKPDQIPQLQKVIDAHTTLIGHNVKGFDLPLLEKHGLTIDRRKLSIVDTLEVCAIKKRLDLLDIKSESYSLKDIVEACKVGTKLELPVDILNKENWTPEDETTVKEYLERDLLITFNLYLFFDSAFNYVKSKLSDYSAYRQKHIVTSPASLAYQCLCDTKYPDRRDIFSRNDNAERVAFEGAGFIEARTEKVQGNIFEVDFKSAYPMAIMNCNLGGSNCICCTPAEKYKGKEFLQLNGAYCSKKMAPVGEFLQQLFTERVDAQKSKDKVKSNLIKLLINSIYGTFGNNAFKLTYNPTAAGDVTRVQRLLYKHFTAFAEQQGLYASYGFTDGVYLLCPDSMTEDEIESICKRWVDGVKPLFAFPQHNFTIEVKKPHKLIIDFDCKKSRYLTVAKNGGVRYKETLFTKKCSPAVFKVRDEVITPQLVQTADINISEPEILAALKHLSSNVELFAEAFECKREDSYKVASNLNAQISKRYGAGKHLLVCNRKIGVGKGKKYCTVSEFNAADLTFDDLEIKQHVRPFEPFIKASKSECLTYEKMSQGFTTRWNNYWK